MHVEMPTSRRARTTTHSRGDAKCIAGRITNDAGQSKRSISPYGYVQLDPKSPFFTNLAQLASCPTVDVPATIRDEGSSAKKKTQSR